VEKVNEKYTQTRKELEDSCAKVPMNEMNKSQKKKEFLSDLFDQCLMVNKYLKKIK
jgi:hypothetical protein